MLLKNKVAVIYGAGGGIGSAVARAFADEGARVFLTGRQLAPVEAVAKEIGAAGGLVAAAEVDALDERAIDEHLHSVIYGVGRLDISFNAVAIPDAGNLGVPLAELDAAQFTRRIEAYATSYFLTARLAARRMIPGKSGVIMTVTTLQSRTGNPGVGGYGPAMAAKEALTRDLSAELAPAGIRVVGLRPQAMPATRTIKDAAQRRAAAYQSRSNSLPSGSAIVMQPASSGGAGSRRLSRVAPCAASRSASASRAAIRASPASPGAARMSRCTRFLTCLRSGTRWKNSRGPRPSGSTTAEASLRFSGGTPIASRACSHDSKPAGGPCSW